LEVDIPREGGESRLRLRRKVGRPAVNVQDDLEQCAEFVPGWHPIVSDPVVARSDHCEARDPGDAVGGEGLGVRESIVDLESQAIGALDQVLEKALGVAAGPALPTGDDQARASFGEVHESDLALKRRQRTADGVDVAIFEQVHAVLLGVCDSVRL
jgi:hypothetical protein